MKVVLVSLSLLAVAFAAPQSYSAPSAGFSSSSGGGYSSGGSSGGFSSSSGGGYSSGGSSGGFSSGGGGGSSYGGSSGGGGGGGYGGGSSGGGGGGGGGYGASCSGGQVLGADGRCTQPIVNRNIYVYAAPEKKFDYGPAPKIPKPKINYNIVFVRTPEGPENQEPIVIPPAQEQTVVYVLSKDEQGEGPKVIEIPDQQRTPEVYYVNYNDGDNPQLPGGIDLQSALSSADSQQGQVIESSGGFGGGGGYSSGGGGGGFSGGSSFSSGGGSYSAPQQSSGYSR